MGNKKYYTTEGSCRGDCGHQHKTRDAAERCLDREQRSCHRAGGYSDRGVTCYTVIAGKNVISCPDCGNVIRDYFVTRFFPKWNIFCNCVEEYRLAMRAEGERR